jgi:hypothetical protein
MLEIAKGSLQPTLEIRELCFPQVGIDNRASDNYGALAQYTA